MAKADSDSLTLLEEHLPLVATGAIFALVLLKVVRVAHGEIGTAVALINASGPATVLLGVLTGLLPYVLAASVVSVAMLVAFKVGSRPLQASWLSLVGLLAFIFLPPLLLLLVLALVLLVFVLSRKLSPPRPWFLIPAVFFLLLFLVPSSPWLPLEAVGLRSENQYAVGYVVRDDSEWMLFLQDDGRNLLVLDSSRVVERNPCRRPSEPFLLSLTGSTTARVLGERTAPAPACPTETGGLGTGPLEYSVYPPIGMMIVYGNLTEIASGPACTADTDRRIVWFDGADTVVEVTVANRIGVEAVATETCRIAYTYETWLPTGAAYSVEIPELSSTRAFMSRFEGPVRVQLDLTIDGKRVLAIASPSPSPSTP